MADKKVCLSEDQMKNILDADRGKKGACQTAIDWIESFYPKPGKTKRETVETYAEKLATRAVNKGKGKVKRKINRRVSKAIDDFVRLF